MLDKMDNVTVEDLLIEDQQPGNPQTPSLRTWRTVIASTEARIAVLTSEVVQLILVL